MIELTSVQLRRAAAIKDRIEELQGKLSRLLGSANGAAAAPKARRMSAAARARIAAAQRARWAKQRGGSVKTAKPRRRFNAATRKRLAALAKARWAKAKASGKKTL